MPASRSRSKDSPTNRRQPRVKPEVYDAVLVPLAERYDVTRFARTHGHDPFRVLIGCLLSLRTKDEVTYPATERLFRRAKTPRGMLRLESRTISKLIYPVGFYRRKTSQIQAICRALLDRFGGEVPRTIDELLTLPGVGRKTANLVVTLGFGLPGICVDVHVHRISNRLGWVRTDHPDRTEEVLRRRLPEGHWIGINEIMVRHGQQICKPISPLCSACPVCDSCRRVGVTRSR